MITNDQKQNLLITELHIMCYFVFVFECFIKLVALESDHLLEEKRTVDKQTEDLAFNNYKTFIETANCSSDIFKDVRQPNSTFCDAFKATYYICS